MARIWQILSIWQFWQFFNTLGDNAVFLIKDKCKSYSVKLKEKLVLQHPSMFSWMNFIYLHVMNIPYLCRVFPLRQWGQLLSIMGVVRFHWTASTISKTIILYRYLTYSFDINNTFAHCFTMHPLISSTYIYRIWLKGVSLLVHWNGLQVQTRVGYKAEKQEIVITATGINEISHQILNQTLAFHLS